MDSLTTMQKIEEFSRRFRRVDARVNSVKEDFYYASIDHRNLRKTLCPLMAGVTHSSPDYFCDLPKGDRMGPYLYVLEYVVSGKGYIETSGKKYEVRAGDTYLISRPMLSAKWYADKDDPYEKKWVNIAGRYLDALMYAYGMTETVYVVHLDTEELIDEMHRILMDYDFKNPQADNFRLMKQLLIFFERMNLAFETIQNKKPERVAFEQIAEYISANLLYESLTPGSVCMSFYISERTLSRLFEKNVGIPPAKYIMLQRVEYSKRLLTTTKLSVEKISEMLYFSGSRHYRQVFTKYCGMPPTEWRKKYTNRTENKRLGQS